MRNSIFILLFITLSSCDEINKLINPEDEYLIEKKVFTSVDEQILQSGNDIKIIIPGKCLKGELELKVKKLNSVDGFNIDQTELGNNLFKINFKGNIDFEKAIQVHINYDKSKIPIGKTASNSVSAYVKQSGQWTQANFEIDEINSKLVINLAKFVSKIQKHDRLLESEGEIVIGDGYTTTDQGEQDNLLTRMNIYKLVFYTAKYNGRSTMSNLFSPKGSNDYLDTIKLIFKDNKFSVDFDSNPGIDPITKTPEVTFFFIYLKYKLNGEMEANSSIIKKITLHNYRKYFTSQIGWDDEFLSFEFNNLIPTTISKNKDTLIYMVNEADIKTKVQSFDWKFIDYWNNSTTYTQNKSDLKKIQLVFIK